MVGAFVSEFFPLIKPVFWPCFNLHLWVLTTDQLQQFSYFDHKVLGNACVAFSSFNLMFRAWVLGFDNVAFSWRAIISIIIWSYQRYIVATMSVATIGQWVMFVICTSFYFVYMSSHCLSWRNLGFKDVGGQSQRNRFVCQCFCIQFDFDGFVPDLSSGQYLHIESLKSYLNRLFSPMSFSSQSLTEQLHWGICNLQ